MRWDRVVADLEGQFDQAERAELAGELDERARAEVGRLRLLDRLRSGVGSRVRVELASGSGPAGEEPVSVRGRLERVGSDWLLMSGASDVEVLVALTAIDIVHGLPRLSATPDSMGVVESRLGLRSVLRAIARDRSAVRLRTRVGATVEGTIDRVGADFVDIAVHQLGELRRASQVRAISAVSVFALATVERSR